MKTSIIVQNLKCGGCVTTIMSKLADLKNISDLNVDVESSTVSFAFENDKEALLVKDKLRALGYPSVENKNSVVAKAMSFLSCATGKISKS